MDHTSCLHIDDYCVIMKDKEVGSFTEDSVRVIIRFMVLAGRDMTDIFKDLVTVLGDLAPGEDSVYQFVSAIRAAAGMDDVNQSNEQNDLRGPDCDDVQHTDTTENTDMGACFNKECEPKKEKERSDKYEWEQKVLDDTVMKGARDKISHSAIVSFSDAELRAAAPEDFMPDTKALCNIVEALKGNTAGLATDLIDLGSGTKICTPGKIDDGKAIYGTNGHGGGCTVMKSKECVLIILYDGGPTNATRMAIEVAEFMEEQGH